MRVLLVSPHPDDELVGAPGTVLTLIRAGHEVVNLACSFGRPDQETVREPELRACLARIGVGFDAIDPPVRMSKSEGNNLTVARARIGWHVLQRAADYDLVISPGIPDGHPAHEATCLAVSDALSALTDPPQWWTWATSPRNWKSELAAPDFHWNLRVPYGTPYMLTAYTALSEHVSEMRRHDYRAVIKERAKACAEHTKCYWPFADLLREMVVSDGVAYASHHASRQAVRH